MFFADHAINLLAFKKALINLKGLGFILAKDLQEFSSSKISKFILVFKSSIHLSRTRTEQMCIDEIQVG